MGSPDPPIPHESSHHAPVSLRHVAEAAGVSRMTASRALRPDAPVAPAVRQRVLAAARDLGYSPDKMVSEVMTSFVKRRPVRYRETLAVLWWPERWSTLKSGDGFFRALNLGMRTSAARHGCGIEDIVLTGELSAGVLNRMLKARNIQGVILTPPASADIRAPELDWESLSSVIVGSSLREPHLHRVQVSHYTSMVHVLHVVKERGFRRPCLLATTGLEERMRRAYTAAFLAWEGDDAASRVWHVPHQGAPGLHDWLRQTGADLVIAECDSWRREVPTPLADRAFVSLDAHDPITGMQQNAFTVGECAIDLLVQVRLRHETGHTATPLMMLAESTWAEGSTLGPPPPHLESAP